MPINLPLVVCYLAHILCDQSTQINMSEHHAFLPKTNFWYPFYKADINTLLRSDQLLSSGQRLATSNFQQISISSHDSSVKCPLAHRSLDVIFSFKPLSSSYILAIHPPIQRNLQQGIIFSCALNTTINHLMPCLFTTTLSRCIKVTVWQAKLVVEQWTECPNTI